jgi:hypothetical protein
MLPALRARGFPSLTSSTAPVTWPVRRLAARLGELARRLEGLDAGRWQLRRRPHLPGAFPRKRRHACP